MKPTSSPSVQPSKSRQITFDRVMASGTALAAVSGVGIIASAPEASAAIVYSGVVNIAAPNNFDGVYLNVLNGSTGTSGGSVPGWDINPYTGSFFNIFYNNTPSTSGALVIAGDFLHGAGVLVDSSGTYNNGTADRSSSVALNSSDNFLGFRFNNENTGSVHYAWAQFSFGATFGQRSIIGYAYEDVAGAGILTGATGVSAIPEPSSSMGVLALGAAGLLIRRRKAA